LHVTFNTEAEADLCEGAGFLSRVGMQYHWHNRGYGGFDDFLGEFLQRKRNAIRKERRKCV